MKKMLMAAVAAVSLGMTGVALAGQPIVHRAVPGQMARNNHEWTTEQRPAYLARNNHEWTTEQRPAYLARNNHEWTTEQRPAYLA